MGGKALADSRWPPAWSNAGPWMKPSMAVEQRGSRLAARHRFGALARPRDRRSLLASLIEHFPGRIGDIDEVIEFARAAEPQAAVDDHTFAVHVLGLPT